MDSSFVFLVFCSFALSSVSPSLFADPKQKRHVMNVARDAAKGYIQLVWHKKYCLQLQGVRVKRGGKKEKYFFWQHKSYGKKFAEKLLNKQRICSRKKKNEVFLSEALSCCLRD